MSLYVYAVLRDAPDRGLGVGLDGAPLRVVDCGDLVAVAAEVARPPGLDAAALRAHDATVRRIADAADPVLPARFGSTVANERALAGWIGGQAEALRDALARVAGQEQMTLRLYIVAAPPADPVAGERSPAAGPGARYLARRIRERYPELPQLETVRRALAPVVTAERVERHDAPPLRASLYHLIPRGSSAAYTAAVESAGPPEGTTLAVSGPWPPYAFAPEPGS